MTEIAKPNRYGGRCSCCGTAVPAAAGTYAPWQGVRHLPGRCKTTTRTYAATIADARMLAENEHIRRMLGAAGYSMQSPYGFGPVRYSGHGLVAMVGFDREIRRDGGWALEPVGFEIYRDGQLAYKGPQPERPRTGAYDADTFAYYASVIETLDRFRDAPG